MQLQSANGLSDRIHHVNVSADAVHIGEPEDPDESDRLEWIALERIAELVGNGSITASTTAAALMQPHVSWAKGGLVALPWIRYLWLRFEAVTHAGLGEEIAGVSRVRFELATQLG